MRTCAECGKTFKGSTTRCPPCRAAEGPCASCGKVFKSCGKRLCGTCSKKERSCTECGRSFRGTTARCLPCQHRERACAECGATFSGVHRRCPACRVVERLCPGCGKTFKGATRHCASCRTPERACAECGRSFKGTGVRCPTCSVKERTCTECGGTFTGRARRCPTCLATERPCAECGKAFRGVQAKCAACRWKALPLEVRRAQSASANNARRARQLAAEVAGPVPPEVYEAIRASGPCVYCGDPSADVDHVRPLVRGGWEHESNLAPACDWCNGSKGGRLLTNWRRADRVAYGVAHSSKVTAEWIRLTASPPIPDPTPMEAMA